MFSMRRYFKLGSTRYRDLGKNVYHKMSDTDCSEHAAAMAYYFLFALFPFILFLTTLLAYIPIPHLLDSILAYTQRMMPGEAFNVIKQNLQSLFLHKQQGLLSLGVILALWYSSNAMVSVMDAMNKVYEVKEGRPFWKLRLQAIFLVVVLSVMFLAAMALLMFGTKIGDWLTQYLMYGQVFQWTWNILLVPVILFLLIVSVALIYYITPDVKQKWKWISPGAVFAIPAWLIMSLLFSWYVNNFGSYNKTYGTIGAIIVLLMWMYYSGFIILAGAVLNAVVEHTSEEGKEPGEKVEGEKEKGSWWSRLFPKHEGGRSRFPGAPGGKAKV